MNKNQRNRAEPDQPEWLIFTVVAILVAWAITGACVEQAHHQEPKQPVSVSDQN